MVNPEIHATLDTWHRTKTNKQKITTQKSKTNEQHGPQLKTGGETIWNTHLRMLYDIRNSRR